MSRRNPRVIAGGPPHDGSAAIRRALLRWFRRCKRNLPWRNSPSPYKVWVSEVMLQQTQIATVIPYYKRFLRSFPTLASLAAAPLERVLEIWSGMGYYRRARHLHLAARSVARDCGGRFPAAYDRARSLPGVGDYTARAVLSIAFNQPYAAMDGNAARVIARLYAIKGGLSQSKFRDAAASRLERLVSRRRPGAFNQAMMELGQAVCLPRAPQCPVCPVRRWCAAFIAGLPEAYPKPRDRRRAEPQHLASAVIKHHARIALVRGLDDGLLPELWNFPSAFGKTNSDALQNLHAKLAALTGEPAQIHAKLGEVRHTITFRNIRVHVYPASISNGARSLRWFTARQLEEAAVSQLARKIARKLQEA